MSALRRIGYFIAQALRLARSSPWLTAVSVLTVAAALSLMGLFFLAFSNASAMLDDLSSSLKVSIYLADDIGEAGQRSVEARVRAHPGVRSLRLLSAEADRERNRRLLDPALIEGLDDEAIPGQPVLELSVDAGLASLGDLDVLTAWAAELEGVEAVEEVRFGAERLRLLFAIVEIVRGVGLALSAVLLISALFFVFVTIRLSVFSRKDEIEILRLVGATRRFVRLPFLFEGALQGLVGALVAMLFIGLLHMELRSLVRDLYRLNVAWSLLPAEMVLWLLVGGPSLGLAAAGVSVGRYLRR